MWLFARFTGIFRTPSSWTSSAGWRGRRELAPRCSATQLGASQARPWTDTARSSSSEPQPPQPPQGSTRFVSQFLRVAFGRAQLSTCRMLMAPLREPHGGDMSVGCGCTGTTSSSRCRCSWPRFSTTPPQGDRRRPGAGRGFEVKYTAKFRVHPLPRRQAPRSLPRTWTRCLPPVSPDQTGWHPCLVHRSGFCGTPREQAGDVVLGLPALDAPVPQMVDKLEDVLKIVDLFVPTQVIEVPRVSSPSCPPPRRVLPVPQAAEQLVDVLLSAAGVVQSWVRDANGHD